MADSPFAPDVGVAPEAPMQPDVEATHGSMGGKGPGSKHLDAALAALAGLAMFAPTGKLMGAASTPLRRVLLGGGMGAGMAALSDAAGAQQAKEGAPAAAPMDPGAGYPSPMHELQDRLKKGGLLPKDFKVDGTSTPGGPTEKAVERLHGMFGDGDPLHILRMQQVPAYRQSEEAKSAEKGKTEADTAAARAAQAETTRKANVDKAIENALKDQNTWGAVAARWAPYVIGGAAGAALGGWNSYRLGKKAAATANEANTFAKENFTGAPTNPDNVAGQAAAVNTFWGSGKGKTPFGRVVTEGELSPNSSSFRVQNHTPVEDLYERTKWDKAKIGLTDLAAVGGAGADYFGSDKMSDYYQRQADEARNRYEKTHDVGDAIEKTRSQSLAGAFNLAKSSAIPFVTGYGLARKIVPMGSAKPSMNAQKGADETRINVQDYLNRQPTGGPRSPLPGGQPRPLNGGGIGTTGNQPALNGQVLPPQQQLPPPNPAPPGVGGHTSQTARDIQNERRANFDRVINGSMAQRTQELLLEHTRDIPVDPDGMRRMTARQINALQRAIEAEHNMPISNFRLRQALRQAGFRIP